ncbi:MAG TPA: hypothetical protein VHV30_07920 [Polyangiaceae bacterium]|jgi:hypothetical protein|nr:hypothetical protein [Polyangiaceae bacterium]
MGTTSDRAPFPASTAARHRAASVAAWLLALGAALAVAGCNEERKAQCDKFIAAMQPIQSGAPSADTVDKVKSDVGSIQFSDQPLGVFAKNYAARLTVLSNTLKLKETTTPDTLPDGTNDVIKTTLKDARTDFDDISRYCSE